MLKKNHSPPSYKTQKKHPLLQQMFFNLYKNSIYYLASL